MGGKRGRKISAGAQHARTKHADFFFVGSKMDHDSIEFDEVAQLRGSWVRGYCGIGLGENGGLEATSRQHADCGTRAV